MATIKRFGAEIYYDLLGDASPNNAIITLVNGHTRSSTDFKVMARHLNAAGYRCLLLDNRASGKSVATTAFSLQDMQDDVCAIWDHLGIKNSDLLGISMGGFVAQGIAITQSVRVRKLILVSTASNQKWIRHSDETWQDDIQVIERKLARYFAPGFAERNQVLFRSMTTQIRSAILNGGFSAKSDLQKSALANSSWEEKLSSIRAKTLIVHGSDDLIVDVQAAIEMSQSIPEARLEIMPGIGHLILAESAKAFYEIVVNFLNEP